MIPVRTMLSHLVLDQHVSVCKEEQCACRSPINAKQYFTNFSINAYLHYEDAVDIMFNGTLNWAVISPEVLCVFEIFKCQVLYPLATIKRETDRQD